MDYKVQYITNTVNRPRTKISKVKGVVVHWTANLNKGADAQANRNYFQNTTRAASAHLNVDDKELIACLPWKKGEAEVGYHVGAKVYKPGIVNKLGKPNYSTIGLEICVNSDGDFKKAYANGVAVIAMMLKEHDLGIENLYRHYDITGKSCPGFFVDNGYAKQFLGTTADKAYAEFKADVAKALGVNTSPVKEIAKTVTNIVLGVGDKGVDVKELQADLVTLGYKLAVDGIFGAGTKKAVVDFQTKQKLDADGLAGPATIAKIADALKPKVPTLGANEYFRVRKWWGLPGSQLGAFKDYNSAKALADKNSGYKVFDEKGTTLYTAK